MINNIDNIINNVINGQVYNDEFDADKLAYYGIINSGIDENGIYNEYDPVVWHDPTFVLPHVVLPYESNENKLGKNIQENTDEVYGKYVPILQIADKVIADADLIRYFELDYTGFMPKVMVEVWDDTTATADNHTNMRRLELSSVITVILVPQDDVYKTIRLSFNITSQHITEEEDNTGTLRILYHYEGSFKLKNLTDESYVENIDYYTCEDCNVKGLPIENAPDYATYYDTMEDVYHILNNNVDKLNSYNTAALLEQTQDVVITANNSKISSLVDKCFNMYKDNPNILNIYSELCSANLEYDENDEHDAIKDETEDFMSKLVAKYPDGTDNNTEITNGISKAMDMYRSTKVFLNNEQLSNDHKTTTWQALHSIAEQCHLGFAGNNSCKEIQDKQQRRITSGHFNDYITDNILPSSGIDTNIINAWIDLYGYLVVMNEGKILNLQNVDTSKLKVTASVGFTQTGDKGIHTKPVIVDRILTNFNMTGATSNLEIADWSNISSFGNIESDGNLSRIVLVNNVEDGGNGSCTQYDIETNINPNDYSITKDMKQRSIVGSVKTIYSPTNESGYNYELQKTINDRFVNKKNTKRFTCRLVRPNFGLQRGTLIGVSLWIANNTYKNKFGEALKHNTDDNSLDSETINKIITTDGYLMPDIDNSGIYYIDGMKFVYDEDLKQIDQYLVLIQQSIRIDFASTVLSAHTDVAVYGAINSTQTNDSKNIEDETSNIDSENMSDEDIITNTGLV